MKNSFEKTLAKKQKEDERLDKEYEDARKAMGRPEFEEFLRRKQAGELEYPPEIYD